MKKICGIIFLAFGLWAGGDAHAAQPPIGNTKEPIDITADRLEVFQEENRAVFTGNVIAIQGDTKLSSEQMTVFYLKPEDKKGAEGSGAIRRIEVERNVFLATPTDTASGLNGVYDLEKREIRLNGDVVLTQKGTTLKGDHLTYDMNTGKSILTSGAAPTAASGPKPKPPRVRALFVPEGAKAKQEEPKTP